MKKEGNTEKYVESKSIRNETLDNVDYDFLDKIKVIPYLTNDMVLTTRQIANYYEVTEEAIRTITKRNRIEFESDGIVILKGEELRKFKEELREVQNETLFSQAKSLALYTKRSLLRAGMILTSSAVATEVRNYLLNIESKANESEKKWEIQREVGKIQRLRLTSAISKYIPDSPHKQFAYPNYTNMIYRLMFGTDAKTLCEQRNCKKENLRDYFTAEELEKIEEMETVVTGLVSMEFTYEQIKEMMIKRYTQKIETQAISQ